MKIFAAIGFIVFIWGIAWFGYQLERAYTASKFGKDSCEYVSCRLGNSIWAFAAGLLGLVLAMMIRYIPSLACYC